MFNVVKILSLMLVFSLIGCKDKSETIRLNAKLEVVDELVRRTKKLEKEGRVDEAGTLAHTTSDLLDEIQVEKQIYEKKSKGP